MILTLVPLTMYRVTYELAQGRPYSKFEELLLKAIGTRGRAEGYTFADLRAIFQIHDRLLTEGLVTLLQEGWVAMEQPDDEIRYLVTEEGKRTIASGRRPSNRRVRTRHASIVRERLTGQLARASDLGIVTVGKFRGGSGGSRHKVWQEALRPRIMRSDVNGGEVDRLLPHGGEHHEWVRWINSVTRVSQDLHYLPVQIDLDREQVLGIPSQWQHLAPMIIQETRERQEELIADADFQNEVRDLLRATARGQETPGASQVPRKVKPFAETSSVACTDVAISTREAGLLTEAILGKGGSYVMIVAGHLNVTRAQVVRDVVIRLNASDAKVDLLWSCDDSVSDPREVYRVLSAARAKATNRDALSMAPTPSGIAADLLLAQTPDGGVALLGHALASPDVDDKTLAVAVQVSDPAMLIALARLCAGWWETALGEQGRLASHRWRHCAQLWADEEARPLIEEPATAMRACPYHPGEDCTGMVELITGPLQETTRQGIVAAPGPRLLISDGKSTTDALQAAFAEKHQSGSEHPYQAFGGADGWCFLRRQKPEGRLSKFPPAPTQKVVADSQSWLIGSNNESGPALSIQLSGHLAVTAWRRTASEVSSWPSP